VKDFQRSTSNIQRPTKAALAAALLLSAGCQMLEERPVRVVSPKIVSIHTPDPSTPETVVQSIIKPGMSQEEKALAVWRYCWKHTYHWPAPKEHRRVMHETDVVFDAVKQLNVYGYTYCFAVRALGEALWEVAGLEARSCGIGGHVLGEAYFDGKYHLLDHEQRGFSRMPDGTVASLEDYRGNARSLVLKPTGPSKPFFPSGKRPLVPYEQKHVITGYLLNHDKHYYQHNKFRTTHSMNVGLRPGERFIRNWDNVGKWHWYPGYTSEYKGNGYGDPWAGPKDKYANLYEEAPRDEDGNPLTFANGLMVYRPDLRKGAKDYADGVLAEQNIDRSGTGFRPAKVGAVATAEFRVRLPYVIVGWPGDIAAEKPEITGAAVVSGTCFRRTQNDKVRILLSIDDGATWKEVWRTRGYGGAARLKPHWSQPHSGEIDFAVDVSKWVEGRYAYVVRFELYASREASDAEIRDFGIDTACQMNAAVLPAVRPGKNEMTVSLEPGPDVFDETIQYGGGKEKAAHERLVHEMRNMKIQPGTYALLSPTKVGQTGHVVYEMAAPKGRKIAWAKVGGAFRASWRISDEEEYRIYYAVGKPKNWTLLWEADQAPYLGHWCFETNHVIKLGKPADRVFVKYEMKRSRYGSGKMLIARLVWGCQGGSLRAPKGGVKVTHVYRVDDKEHRRSEVVTTKAQSYAFNVRGRKVRNVSVTAEWAERPPASDGPHPLMLERPKVKRREIRDLKKIKAMWAALKRMDKQPTIETAIDVMWNCEHEWMRNYVVGALAAFGGDKARAELKKAIGKRDWALGLYLELLAHEGPAVELVAAFKKADWRGRAKIAELLAVRNDPSALPALRAAIGKEDTKDTLAEEVAALVRIGGAQAADEGIAQLKNCRPRGKVKVAAALAKAGVPRGFAALNAALKSKDRYTRYFAAKGLAESGRPEAEPGLLIALKDKSRWVRQAATAGLGRAGTKKALPALRKMAKSDPLPYLRAEADWAISRVASR